MDKILIFINALAMSLTGCALMIFFDLSDVDIVVFAIVFLFYVFFNSAILIAVKKSHPSCRIIDAVKVQYYSAMGSFFGLVAGVLISWILVFPYSYFFGHPDISWSENATVGFMFVVGVTILLCIIFSVKSSYQSAKKLFLHSVSSS